MKVTAKHMAPEVEATTPEELAAVLNGPLYRGSPCALSTSNNAYAGDEAVRFVAQNGRRRLEAVMSRAEWEEFYRLRHRAEWHA